MSEPNGVPKRKRVSRFARATRHSSANWLATLEIGPTSPPSFWSRFCVPRSPHEWLEITPG